MGELSEVDTKFIYAMNLVPPKDLKSFVHPSTWHYSLAGVWHTFIFLKSMVNEHVFMNSMSLSNDFNPW
jgi:hypothetical protein